MRDRNSIKQISNKKILFLSVAFMLFHLCCSYSPYFQDYHVNQQVELVYSTPGREATASTFDQDGSNYFYQNDQLQKEQSLVNQDSFAGEVSTNYPGKESSYQLSVQLSFNKQKNIYLSVKENTAKTKIRTYHSNYLDEDDIKG